MSQTASRSFLLFVVLLTPSLAACSEKKGPTKDLVSAPAAKCDFGDNVACQAECDAGGVGACYFVARALSSGIDMERDEKRADALFKDACDRGVGDACSAIALGFLNDKDPDNRGNSNEEFLEVVSLFERGCALGSSKACNNMGSFLRRKSLGRQTESLGFFERSCSLGAAHAVTGCVEAADTLREGKFGSAADPARADELIVRACKLGSAHSCKEARSHGHTVDMSPELLFQFRVERCRRGELYMCLDAADNLEDGVGTRRNFREAERLWRIACGGDVKVGFACMRLGALLLHVARSPSDVEDALPVLRRACERKSPLGCRQLADLYLLGHAVSQDVAEAGRLYERACALDEEPACHLARAITQPDANGADILAEACRSGDDMSCRATARVQKTQLGVK